MVKSFIDIIILGRLRNVPSSGYDIVGYIYRRKGVLLSPGTVYAALYSLERNGLINGRSESRKRVYQITREG